MLTLPSPLDGARPPSSPRPRVPSPHAGFGHPGLRGLRPFGTLIGSLQSQTVYKVQGVTTALCSPACAGCPAPPILLRPPARPANTKRRQGRRTPKELFEAAFPRRLLRLSGHHNQQVTLCSPPCRPCFQAAKRRQYKREQTGPLHLAAQEEQLHQPDHAGECEQARSLFDPVAHRLEYPREFTLTETPFRAVRVLSDCVQERNEDRPEKGGPERASTFSKDCPGLCAPSCIHHMFHMRKYESPPSAMTPPKSLMSGKKRIPEMRR